MGLSPPIEGYVRTWQGLCLVDDGFRLEKQKDNCTALYRTDFFYVTKIGPVIKLLLVDIIHYVCVIFQSLQVNPEKIQQIRPRPFHFIIHFVIEQYTSCSNRAGASKKKIINK